MSDPIYEYTTRYVAGNPGVERFTSAFDVEYEHEGWKRVWSDVTVSGIFIVYRREKGR